MKNFVRICIVAVLVLVVDLTTKHFLYDVSYNNLIPNFISIASNGGNDGAAFGLFSGNVNALAIISVVIMIGLLIFNKFIKNKSWLYCIAFGFIMGGALGNLIDRICFGYVRDFIYLDFLPNFPIFNFADSFLVIGAILMAIFILFFSNKGKKDED